MNGHYVSILTRTVFVAFLLLLRDRRLSLVTEFTDLLQAEVVWLKVRGLKILEIRKEVDNVIVRYGLFFIGFFRCFVIISHLFSLFISIQLLLLEGLFFNIVYYAVNAVRQLHVLVQQNVYFCFHFFQVLFRCLFVHLFVVVELINLKSYFV